MATRVTPRIAAFLVVLACLASAVAPSGAFQRPIVQEGKDPSEGAPQGGQNAPPGSTGPHVSPDLAAAVASATAPNAIIPVVVQGTDLATLAQILRSVAGEFRFARARQLGVIRSYALDLTADGVTRLMAYPQILNIDLDRAVVTSEYGSNHLRYTTGADQVIGSRNFSDCRFSGTP